MIEVTKPESDSTRDVGETRSCDEKPRRLNGKRVKRIVFRSALGVVALTAFGVIGFQTAVAVWPYPDGIDRLLPPSKIVEDRTGVELIALAAPDGQWRLPLASNEISPHLLHAIVAVEDARFFDHSGVDWPAGLMAAWQNFTSLGVRRGASTLTMQLHRLRDPRPRSLLSKIEQAVRATQIEKTTDKQTILTEYANRAPFGGNLVGAGAASWRYFGKPCASLSLGEAALLAGLPKSPTRYRPDRYPERAARRRSHVLDRMLACGFISAIERDQANAEPITAQWRPLPQATDPAAVSPLAFVADQSPVMTHRIRSTIDVATQAQVQGAAREHLAALASSGVSAVAVVVLDNDSAECLAAVSLAPGATRLVDLTRRQRSTGSVLKPLIYAAAFEAGTCSPDALLDDSPTAWAGYVPQDYDRVFRGQISAGEALAESRNIPAMVVLARTGVEHVTRVMQNAGLKSLRHTGEGYGLSLAIGGAEATPLEIATAYAGLSRGGLFRAARFRLAGTAGGPSSNEAAPRFVSANASWQVLTALSDPARTAPLSRRAASLNAAWKTGTSSGHRDAWCAAVTRRRTVVVWMGNPGGEGSAALVGRDAAAPLALDLIAALDASPNDWPVVVSSLAIARPRESARLSIVSPAPDREVILNSDVPADRQRILLKAVGGSEAAIHWFIDGAQWATSDVSQPVWWAPVAGTHEVRVVNGSGAAAFTRITVRGN